MNHHAFLEPRRRRDFFDSVLLSIQRGELSKSGTDICFRATLSSSPNDAEEVRIMGLTISDRSISRVLSIGEEQGRRN